MKKNINKIILGILLIGFVFSFYLIFNIKEQQDNLNENLSEVQDQYESLLKNFDDQTMKFQGLLEDNNELSMSLTELKDSISTEEEGFNEVYKEGVIHFYISKLDDPDFISYYNHDYIWYIAPEALGMIGKPAIPYLMNELETEDTYKLSMIFYALLLASQDDEVKALTDGEYINISAFDEDEYVNNKMLINTWWEKYKEKF